MLGSLVQDIESGRFEGPQNCLYSRSSVDWLECVMRFGQVRRCSLACSDFEDDQKFNPCNPGQVINCGGHLGFCLEIEELIEEVSVMVPSTCFDLRVAEVE